ncbi:hypothetical protein PC110_g22760 [Phytophthora cactorum]|uniref:Uncharacterized protein n=1 Tax=Phytophthora cactorum TaxID=29920 RepID=A0A329RAA5_9STRA|nr:hypothetical protein PC110_g22760 [Phytophthora cactorum]
MSTTNKDFNYIFNTSRKDRKVSKALSGYDTEARVLLKDLKSFDAQTQEKITAVQQYVFATCFQLDQAKYNLKELHAEGPSVKRLEACVQLAGSALAGLLAWSTQLASTTCNTKPQLPTNTEA